MQDDTRAVSFTLHDLAHDLALAVSSNNHFFQKNYQQELLTNVSARQRVFVLHGCSDKLPSDDLFLSTKYLRVLDIRDCWLQKLPESICQLRQLRYLNLSGSTRLVSLPDSFGDLINLGHIDLSSCSGLSKLPGSFGNLTSVMHINLSGCAGLQSLNESFGNLTNVVHVNLSGCVGLKSLPESFGLLEKMEYLDLSSCSCLDEIQIALGRLTNLQHLNLSHPCCYIAQHRFHLKGLKDVWVKLTNLQYLNLSMCLNPIFCYLSEQERVEYIESISGLHKLEHLDLSHNIFLSNLPESLGQLSQLQTLNIFGCARLKRIEKWMGERNFPSKSLVVSNCLGLEMYQFVVRTDGGAKSSNLSQLKDVSCKELEISCLEKVISTEEVQSIGLPEKKKLQKLTLVWSTAPDDASFKDHETLLAELVPPQNLQCFELHGYRSQHLPSSIFSDLPNLVEVTMVDIPSCSNLAPLSVLPNLKRLILRRVAKVTRIDARCSSGGSKAAFQRLLHVTLDDMVNLEEFSNCSSSDEFVMFPTVDEFVINKCPKLKFGDSPPKARMLVISDCNQLMSSPLKRGEHDAVEDPSSSTSTAITCGPVTEVVIESCKVPLDELNWSLLQGLAPLHSLHIRNCSEKIMSPEIMKGHLSPLKLLCFSHCDSMTTLPEHVVQVQDTSLQELVIHECCGIKSLPQIICEENKKHNPHGPPSISESEEKKKHYPLLRIRGCPELKQWCELEENKMKLAHIQIIFEYVPGVIISLTLHMLDQLIFFPPSL